jgi:uncharacterized protein (DUF934 family)
MQIIKDKEIIEDQWQHIADDPIPPEGRITVSLNRWKAEKDRLTAREGGELGLRLSTEDSLDEIADDLKHFQLIALEFPTFTDGRTFSFARLLRERCHFQGELRAIGDFLPDQVFFLSRVGINAFEFDETADLNDALAALATFTVAYQAAAGEAEPPYRRSVSKPPESGASM